MFSALKRWCGKMLYVQHAMPGVRVRAAGWGGGPHGVMAGPGSKVRTTGPTITLPDRGGNYRSQVFRGCWCVVEPADRKLYTSMCCSYPRRNGCVSGEYTSTSPMVRRIHTQPGGGVGSGAPVGHSTGRSRMPHRPPDSLIHACPAGGAGIASPAGTVTSSLAMSGVGVGDRECAEPVGVYGVPPDAPRAPQRDPVGVEVHVLGCGYLHGTDRRCDS